MKAGPGECWNIARAANAESNAERRLQARTSTAGPPRQRFPLASGNNDAG